MDWGQVDSSYSPATFPFPVLECLDLPYDIYPLQPWRRVVVRRALLHGRVRYTTPPQRGEKSGGVSERMRTELRRSYEFENPRKWDEETVTLGRAEWRKRDGPLLMDSFRDER